ncbi:MAG: PAS domain-containing protein, partial [Candidatus Eremiobacteraeota bacterium]|nr:PAS domain-containing protein [Candidatus Eremiobacteraeota bacterium]
MNKSKSRYAYASATDLRSLVNSFGEAVLVVDDQGEVVFADPNAELLFDRDVSHLLGESAPCELREGELEVARGDETIRAHCRSEELVWSGNLATAYFLRAVDRAMLDLEGKLTASEERISLAEEALRDAEAGHNQARERLDEISVEVEGLSQENELLKATVSELEKQVST